VLVDHASDISINGLNSIHLLHRDHLAIPVPHGSLDLIEQARERLLALLLVQEEVLPIPPPVPRAIEASEQERIRSMARGEVGTGAKRRWIEFVEEDEECQENAAPEDEVGSPAEKQYGPLDGAGLLEGPKERHLLAYTCGANLADAFRR